MPENMICRVSAVCTTTSPFFRYFTIVGQHGSKVKALRVLGYMLPMINTRCRLICYESCLSEKLYQVRIKNILIYDIAAVVMVRHNFQLCIRQYFS